MNDLATKNVHDILHTALTCVLQIDASRSSFALLKPAFSLLIFSQFLRQSCAKAFSSNCLDFIKLISIATKGYCIVKTLPDPTTATGDRTVSQPTPVNQLYHVQVYLNCIEELRIAMNQHLQSIANENVSYADACFFHKYQGVYVEIALNILPGDVNVKGMLDDVLHQFITLWKELSAIIMPTFTEPKSGQ